MLWWSLQFGTSLMDQQNHLVAQSELLSHEALGEMPVDGDTTALADRSDPDDQLAAVRGIVIGVALGVVTWGVVTWGVVTWGVVMWVVMWQISG